MRIAAFFISGFCLLLIGNSTSMANTNTPTVANPAQNNNGAEKKAPYRDPMNICGQSCAYITAAEMMSLYAEYYRLHNLKGAYEGQEGFQAGKNFREDLAATVQKCVANENNCSADDRAKLVKASVTYNFGKDIRRVIMENQTFAENIKTLVRPGGKFKPNGTGYEPWLAGSKTMKVKNPWTPADIKFRERDPFQIPIDSNFGLRTFDEEKAILGPQFMTEYGKFLNSYTNPNRNLFRQSQKISGNKDINSGIVDDARFADVSRVHGTNIVRKSVAEFQDSLRNPELRTITQKEAEAKVWDYTPSRLHELGFIRTNPGLIEGQKIVKPMEEFRAEAKKINEAVEKKSREIAKSGATQRGIYVDLDKFNNFLEELWPTAAGEKIRKR